MEHLTKAIDSKLKSARLSRLVGGRIYEDFASSYTRYPYIVWFIVSSQKEKTFTENFENTSIQFSIFSENTSSVEIKQIYGQLSLLMDECSLKMDGGIVYLMQETNLVTMVEPVTTATGETFVRHYAVDFDILTEKT